MSKLTRKLTCLMAALALCTMMTGCGPRMARHLIGAAVVGAAVAGTVAVVAAHDAHYHHYNCGCMRQWRDDHWTYHYQGSWEYYDGRAGVWYRY